VLQTDSCNCNPFRTELLWNWQQGTRTKSITLTILSEQMKINIIWKPLEIGYKFHFTGLIWFISFDTQNWPPLYTAFCHNRAVTQQQQSVAFNSHNTQWKKCKLALSGKVLRYAKTSFYNPTQIWPLGFLKTTLNRYHTNRLKQHNTKSQQQTSVGHNSQNTHWKNINKYSMERYWKDLQLKFEWPMQILAIRHLNKTSIC
jgi:hypothetical protein